MGVKLKPQFNYRKKDKVLVSTGYYLEINLKGRWPREWYPGGAIKDNLPKSEKKRELEKVEQWYSSRKDDIINQVVGIEGSYQIHLLVRAAMQKYLDADKIKAMNDFKVLRAACNQYIKFVPQRLQFMHVDEEHFQDFIEWLADQDYSSKTIMVYWSHISTFYGAMQKNKYWRGDIDKMKIEFPTLVMAETNWLDADEMRTLYATPCPDERIRHAYIFMCYSGRDFGDMLTLEPSQLDIDREARTGTIIRDRKKLQIDSKIVKADKDKHKVAVKALHPTAIDMILSASPSADGQYVFDVPERGAALSWMTDKFNKLLQKWVDDSGIKKKITSRSGRHFHSTYLPNDATGYELTDHSPKSAAGKRYRHDRMEIQQKALNHLPSIDGA